MTLDQDVEKNLNMIKATLNPESRKPILSGANSVGSVLSKELAQYESYVREHGGFDQSKIVEITQGIEDALYNVFKEHIGEFVVAQGGLSVVGQEEKRKKLSEYFGWDSDFFKSSITQTKDIDYDVFAGNLIGNTKQSALRLLVGSGYRAVETIMNDPLNRNLLFETFKPDVSTGIGWSSYALLNSKDYRAVGQLIQDIYEKKESGNLVKSSQGHLDYTRIQPATDNETIKFGNPTGSLMTR